MSGQATIEKISLIRPDDWHLHLRDGDALDITVPHSARRFARAIVMPNLRPPVTTTAAARAYHERILTSLPGDLSFQPLMTLYLTEVTTPAEIERARESGIVHGVKLYPAGATTHSEAGVRDIEIIYPALEAMQAGGLPLLVHGEVTDPAVDLFDREAVFIERVLTPLLDRFSDLKCVLEHVTTREGIEFVKGAGQRVAATITPQHLLYNRNALFAGGLRPHRYCLPVLKRERHRRAVLDAAVSGDPKFFLGTDSAPHPQDAKESACGCAGIFSAPLAIELYAEIFEAEGRLNALEAFASLNGARFYGLPVNGEKITLIKESWTVPRDYPYGNERVVPLRAGEPVRWRLAE